MTSSACQFQGHAMQKACVKHTIRKVRSHRMQCVALRRLCGMLRRFAAYHMTPSTHCIDIVLSIMPSVPLYRKR